MLGGCPELRDSALSGIRGADQRRRIEFAAAYQSECEPGGLYGALMKVEPIGLEPTTSCMP